MVGKQSYLLGFVPTRSETSSVSAMSEIAGDPNEEEEFEFDPFSSRIGASTRLFLDHLDTCSGLIRHVGQNQRRIRKSPAEIDAAKRLPSKDRREIDQLITVVVEQLPAMVDEIIQSLVPEDLSEDPVLEEGGHHSLSEEEEAALAEYIGVRGLYRDIWNRFSEYQGNADAIAYIQYELLDRTSKPPAEVLSEALLPGIVSAFERFISGLLRAALSKHPLGLGALPDVPFGIVSGLSTKDDIERYLIDQKIRSVLKGSPEDWAKDLKQWTRISLQELGADWPAVREAVQRRHSVIHAGGRADAEYLAKVDPELRDGVVAGSPLKCSPEYMELVLENFRVLAMVLALRWAHHFGKLEPLQVLPDLVNHIYELERLGRWRAAYLVSDVSVGLHENNYDLDDFLRVNWWLCRRRLGLSSDEMIGQIHQWKPREANLEAARYALLDDDQALARAVRRVMGESILPLERKHFREMVIWDEAKERSAEVRAAFSGRSASSSVNRPRHSKRRQRK